MASLRSLIYIFFVTVALVLLLNGGQRGTDAQSLTDVMLGSSTFYEIAMGLYEMLPQVVKPAIEEFMKSTGMQWIDENTVLVTVGKVTFNISGPSECSICKGLAKVIKLEDYSTLLPAVVDLCSNILKPLGVRVDPLCTGLMALQVPHIAKVLKDKRVTPARFCEYINSCFPAPEKQKTKKMNCKPCKPYPIEDNCDSDLKVVQLTDIHVERSYALDSSATCGLPVCCLKKWGTGNASEFGDYNCNIPPRTIELFVKKVKTFNPDIILFSGDVPPHTMWDETAQSQMACTKLLVDILKRLLPNYNVYPIIGNHEMFPTNLFSQKYLSYTKGFIKEWIYLWHPLAKFNQMKVHGSGSYSVILRPGLRLIVFNTNYMYTLNFFNALNDLRLGEAYEMRKFVEQRLMEARVSCEKVILAGHHPPGSNDYMITGSRWFEQLVLEYSDVIVLMPAGHTHIDEFRMFYDSKKRAKAVLYVAPSMTTAGVKNPSMRIFELDRSTYVVNDYQHYYLNLPYANGKYLKKAWDLMITLLYSAKKEYNLPDLSPKSWDNLLKRFKTNSTLLRTHMAHSNANAQTASNGVCDDTCALNYICQLANANYDDYSNCLDSVAAASATPPPPPRPT